MTSQPYPLHGPEGHSCAECGANLGPEGKDVYAHTINCFSLENMGPHSLFQEAEAFENRERGRRVRANLTPIIFPESVDLGSSEGGEES